jgi:hypothetical protein
MLEVGRALAPLEQRMRGGEITLLFAEIGLPSSDAVLGEQAVETAIGAAAAALGELPGVLSDLAAAIKAQDALQIATALAAATPIIKSVSAAIDGGSDAIRAAAQAAGPGRAEVEAFATELAQRLFGYALATHLEREKPVAGHLLTLVGIIESSPQAATAATPAHVRRVLRLDRIGALLDDPVGVLAQIYGWGSPDLNWDLLLRRLSIFLGRVTDFAFVQPGPPRSCASSPSTSASPTIRSPAFRPCCGSRRPKA